MDDFYFFAIAILAVVLIAVLLHIVARGFARASGERAAFGPLEGPRRPLIRPGFVLSLLGLLFLGICSAPLFSWWPPQWMERRARRQSVMNRVEAVGGWERLSADLALLLTTNNSPGLRISVSSTSNGLPPSLSALRLRSIELNPFQRSNSALLIFYFPRRHHAGYSIFVVTSGTNAAADVELLRSRWRRSTSVQQLTNGIYEVY